MIYLNEDTELLNVPRTWSDRIETKLTPDFNSDFNNDFEILVI